MEELSLGDRLKSIPARLEWLPENCVFATNSNLSFLYILQPDGVNLSYFKIRIFDLTEFIVWNILDL